MQALCAVWQPVWEAAVLARAAMAAEIATMRDVKRDDAKVIA